MKANKDVLQVRQDYASVADFVKITVLDRTSRVNAGGTRKLCCPHEHHV